MWGRAADHCLTTDMAKGPTLLHVCRYSTYNRSLAPHCCAVEWAHIPADNMLLAHPSPPFPVLQARKRNNILSTSPCNILCAEQDLYVADIGGCLRVKLGPRMDMGKWTPSKEEWNKVASGTDFCVWERKQ